MVFASAPFTMPFVVRDFYNHGMNFEKWRDSTGG